MKDKFRVIISLVLLFLLSIGNILVPTRVFSNKENRYLSVFPKVSLEAIISGKFGSGFEDYSTDQFILRDYWTGLKTLSDLAILKKDNGRVYFGKGDYLFEVDEDINEDNITKNIQYINSFIEKMEKENIKVYLVLIPSKSTVLNDKLPKYAPTIDEEYIEKLIRDLSKDGFQIESLEEILREKTNEYIYYRTDHHWTSRGAYYGYAYLMEILGKDPIGLEKFQVESISDTFFGTIYRKANYYKGNPDSIHIYKYGDNIKKILVNGMEEIPSIFDDSYLDKVDKYSYFLGGDKALVEIDTGISNGQRLMIVKDSFANSLIPFLVNHFEKIIIVDPRYYKGSMEGLGREKEIDQVILLFNTKNYNEKGRFFSLSQ